MGGDSGPHRFGEDPASRCPIREINIGSIGGPSRQLQWNGGNAGRPEANNNGPPEGSPLLVQRLTVDQSPNTDASEGACSLP